MDKNAYYIGISAWQKAIRRGDTETALRMLHLIQGVCSSSELQGLYRRIYVVLYEDIERGDMDIISTIGSYLNEKQPREVYCNPTALERITIRFSEAVKCHDAHHAQHLFSNAHNLRDPDDSEERRMKDARDTGDQKKFGLAAWCLYKLNREVFWAKLLRLVPKERHELVFLAKRAWSRGSEHAWASAVLLAFDNPSDKMPEARILKPTLYSGFPGYAIDCHTLVGKKVLEAAATKFDTSYDEFMFACWENEGRLLKGAVYDKQMKWRPARRPSRTKLWKEASEEIDSLREYFMKKMYRGTIP